MGHHSHQGFTLAEVLTALVVVAVLTAVAIPLWRVHVLRVNRLDARDALIAVQSAQDRHFGRHARYATQLGTPPPDGLGIEPATPRGLYRLTLTTQPDGLGYLAEARALAREGQAGDSRCAAFSIDHVGQMRARDAAGEDRSADCWH